MKNITPWRDPIVEEIHQIRDQLAARYGNNLHDIVAHYREKEQQDPKKQISFAPKRPVGWVDTQKVTVIH
jgi:hypothetical protein